MGKKSKSVDKKEKKSKSKEKGDKPVKESKSKDKKGKDKKDKKDKRKSKSKSKLEGDGHRGSKGDLGFEVKLDPYAQYPTEEDLKRFGPLSVEAKQAHTAIVLLDSEEDHVLIESLNSLQRFCSKRLTNREIFVMLGGVDKIWKFFHHQHKIIQRLALKILAIVSAVHKVKLLCRDYGIAEEIEKFEESEDPVVLEYVGAILNNLATLYAGRIQIIRQGGIPFLLKLADHKDPDIKKNVAETLLHVLEEPLHNDLVLQPESIQKFYKLIDSEFASIQIVALSIFEKLSRRPSGVKLVQETGIIAKMMLKLDNPEFGDLHRVYLQILLNLSQDVANCRKMAGLLGQLTHLVDHSKDLQVLVRTVCLLGKMARIPLITKSLVTFCEIVPKLIFIVSKYADSELRSAAAYTAAQIASTDYKARGQLIEIFKPLKNFFFDMRATTPCYQNILLAVSVILEDGEEAGIQFIKADGLSMLYQVCASEHKAGKYTNHTFISALSCINSLGHFNDFRQAMVNEGLIPAILNMMTSRSTHVVALASTALSTLLCVEEGRLQFLEQNGYDHIVTALRCPELNVVIAIGPLISAVASYPEIAYNLVNNGILTVLLERQDVISKNGPMRVAMERLISSHLPAKYAYKGHIGAYEKLPHGFYDIGIIQSAQVFIPLEKIKFEEREKHQKVIYVNFDSSCDAKLFQESPILITLESEETVSLLGIAAQVRTLMPDNVRSEKDLVGLIATVVCSKLGGTLDKWRVSAEAENIELADFQSKHQSVAVPLTLMSTGAHRPRALMFKALADIFGIPCSLDRAGFKKCWNVVLIRAKKMHTCCPCPETPEDEQNMFFTERLRRFVVDLLYAPGTLFPLYSYEADTYCFC